MSLDAMPTRPQRVAIIGGGISGMAAAYLLSPQHAVTLYEAAPRLGGHARTVIAGKNGDRPVDTGFIVFNYANYPHMTKMFEALDVPVAKSEMTYGVSIDSGRIEYGLGLCSMTAQRRNLLRPSYYRMFRDILRFNRHAEAAAVDDDMTIAELADRLKLGDWFQRYYLMPFCGAIWSTPTEAIRAFPARTLVQFFRNHALLNVFGQHQWWTVDGGSIEYVRRLERHLRGHGVAIHTGAPVQKVTRTGLTSTVQCDAVAPQAPYDQVIFACHADQALRLIDRPTRQEEAALSAIRFQDNEMVLHCDPAQMPKRQPVWASWVYRADTSQPETAIGVTYWMNALQNIPRADPIFGSLNPTAPIPDHLIYDQTRFRHPVFDRAALRAQGQLDAMQGQNNTWFAGAYTRHGFHEDGFASAVRIARMMERQPA